MRMRLREEGKSQLCFKSSAINLNTHCFISLALGKHKISMGVHVFPPRFPIEPATWNLKQNLEPVNLRTWNP
jgi:hypothetical protein